MNFKAMTFDKLIVARAQLELEIEKRIDRRRLTLREALDELRRLPVGKRPMKAARKKHPLKGNKLPPRYRNPNDHSQTWAGRGLRPRWLSQALKDGKKLESFAIR